MADFSGCNLNPGRAFAFWARKKGRTPMPGLMPMLLATSHLMLAADRVPEFNLDPSCRASTMASGMADRDESSCKKDEGAAHDKLTQDWAQYSPAQKTECVRLT